MILSVTPSNECKKKIRCKYCYLKNRKANASFKIIHNKMEELIQNNRPEVVTFAYNNGYPIKQFYKLIENAALYSKVSVTMQPESIKEFQKEVFEKINFIALSCNTYNYKKINLEEVSGLVNEYNPLIKIGINFLVDELPKLQDLIRFFKVNEKFIEQFHILIPKMYPVPYKVNDLINISKVLKLMFQNKVFIDECLRTIITGTPCSRHGNLLSLNADASITKCSFADINDSNKLVKKCPYFMGE